MPIFLDRYDCSRGAGISIVLFHQENLKIQKEFDCLILAFWFDQRRNRKFHLIEAPNLQTLKEMQFCLNGSPPVEIIQIEENLIEAFLIKIENSWFSAGKIISPSELFQNLAFCAVMVIKLYNRDLNLTNENIQISKKVCENIKTCSENLIRKNNGKKVKDIFEGCIYSFDSIPQSIECALQVQKKFDTQLKKASCKTLALRMGLDLKGPILVQSFSSNENLMLAQRLCNIAGKNQIMVSSKLKEWFQKENRVPVGKNEALKSLNDKDEKFFNHFMDILEQDYKEELKIGDFCKKTGKSRSQLYRKILDVTHLTPVEFLNEFRLKKAVELMDMQKGRNISEIAFESGFNSLSYFSRRFKKKYGLHPSAYLNREIELL